MKRLLFSVGLLLCTAQVSWSIFGLGDIVHDPIALVQHIATQLNTLKSSITQVAMEANQVQQLAHETQSLALQAQNLVKLPGSMVQGVQDAITQYTSLLSDARGLSYSLSASVGQFEALYRTGGTTPIGANTQAVLTQVREAGRTATQISAVLTRLCDQQTQIGQAQAASEAAVGQMQAIQSTNNLMAIMAQQQVGLQEVQAVALRLQMSNTMREVTAEERSKLNAEAWLQTWPTTGFRGPGQGQGQRLPE